MNETQLLLAGQYDTASKKVAIADSACNVEHEMADFLHTVQAHPEERAFVVGLFKRFLADESRPSDWEFIQFCLHALRWEEMRAFVRELQTKARSANDWTELRILGHLLAAFGDDWDEAEMFREFGGGWPSCKSFPENWYQPEDIQDRREVEEQLLKEVGEGHVLKGVRVQLVARRRGTGDALFALNGGRIAQVRMTWRDEMETEPKLPATTVFPNFQAWLSFWAEP
jgi:hypothetical protein